MDLHERSVQCVLKNQDGHIVRESKTVKDERRILTLLDGTNASVVMESGRNHRHIYDVLKERGYGDQFRTKCYRWSPAAWRAGGTQAPASSHGVLIKQLQPRKVISRPTAYSLSIGLA